MGFAIYQDMTEVYNNPDKWINHGRYALEENCKHHEKGQIENNISYSGYCEKCEVSEDSAIPMMNYLYPLELDNFEKDKVLKIVNGTNCTILENTETKEYFLALCGGGMNLSQDIAYAYFIAERWIPTDLLNEVAIQPCLSLGKKKYKILAREIIRQLRHNELRLKQKRKEWKETYKKFNQMSKEEQNKQ
jgi:hypothetical protein